MKIYLINLDRRPDRRAAMEGEAARAGLCLARVSAVDGQSPASAGVDRWFAASGPLGALSHSEKCCALSHRAAWEALAESGEDYAAILEDDIRLSPAAGALLAGHEWIPGGIDLLKLEHFGPESQHVLVTEQCELAHAGAAVARLASRHTGAAAYILSRRAALLLLEQTRFTLPVDHLLFNPNNSPLFAKLQPWQLMPPLARQRDFVGARSDLEPSRVPLRRFSLAYVRREMVRAAYEWRLVPQQLRLLLSGQGRLVAIGRSGREKGGTQPQPSPMPAE
jgi:glycosyl transferase family 25